MIQFLSMPHSQRNRTLRIMITRINHDAIDILIIRHNSPLLLLLLVGIISSIAVIFQNGKHIFTNLPRRTVAQIHNAVGMRVGRAVEGYFDLEASAAETEE